MGYKLENLHYNGLQLTNCYAKVNECRTIFEADKVQIQFVVSVYPSREASISNQCIFPIYDNAFILDKNSYDVDLKKNIYTWLNSKIAEEGSHESFVFADAEIL